MDESKKMALAKKKLAIQTVIETANKDTANQFFKNKYADLCEVVNTIKAAMVAAGQYLLIEQIPHTAYGEPGKAPMVTITTRITDVDSGESESFDLSSLPAQDTPQGIGSTITYLRRYALMPTFGVVPEDDDGNSASGKNKDGMDQRLPSDRTPQREMPAPRTAGPATPATATPAPSTAPGPRPTRTRPAPRTAAPAEVAPDDPANDLPWPSDAPEDTSPRRAPPLPDQNRLITKEEYGNISAAVKGHKIIVDKMYGYMDDTFKKRDPRLLSAAEYQTLMDTITNNPEVINEGMGF